MCGSMILGLVEVFFVMKEIKGSQYSSVSNQVKEEDAVYDVVDEKEYAERVKGRVEEGFIVDDDGEYVEDGRYGELICRTRDVD